MNILAYIADAWILGTYALMSWRPQRVCWFHLANAIGCVPIIGIEIAGGAWPAVVLTGSFGALGWYGLWNLR